MSSNSKPTVIHLEGDNTNLANLCGPLDENLQQIASGYRVEIARRGNRITVRGNNSGNAAKAVEWFHRRAVHQELSSNDIQLGLAELGAHQHNDYEQELSPDPRLKELPPVNDLSLGLRTPKTSVRPRTPSQREYLNNILNNDITFGTGPAGTGKTWLAVACAVDALERDQVERLILTRPAVEAGERLGFLPGDLSQKIDPYLRPLYDALYDLMGYEKVQRLFEKQTIEIAPLAYMRGRTLNNAFVILDEAQNTTNEQMQMFLTRIGFSSKAVINGDPSQTDLPKGQSSGLSNAIKILNRVNGIAHTSFTSRDVVRHPLVARIIQAYEQHNGNQT